MLVPQKPLRHTQNSSGRNYEAVHRGFIKRNCQNHKKSLDINQTLTYYFIIMAKEEPKEEKKETISAPEVINLEKVIDIDSLTENSIIVLKFKEATPQVAITINAIAERYGKLVRAKNGSIIVISPEDSVENLSEERMNSLGWFKKGKIIT